MATTPFRDRRDAGQRLARALASYANRDDVVVLALPRGGVPVGFEVARALRAPFDVFLVRKLGAPGHPEFAIGAIAAGGMQVLSEDVISALSISPAMVEQIATRERLELARRDKAYHGDRPKPPLRDKTVIVIDDGLATGSTMEAAVSALRRHHAAKIIVAAPVGAADSCHRLRAMADEVVCLETPEQFEAVGLWYQAFDQTTDAEVIELLRRASSRGISTTPVAAGTEIDRVRAGALVLKDDDASSYDALIKAIGSARIVLLGEASHGTHEFYRERAFITERLITQAGFSAVAVEADWPDAYRVNRYVRGTSGDDNATDALGDFGRFPIWMWRNTDVVAFVQWLRAHNDTQPVDRRTGFYGIDLYSLRTSIQAVLGYLSKVDPAAAGVARARYACFDQFGAEPQSYGYATGSGLAASCEQQVVTQLVDMQRRRAEYASRDGRIARDDFFYAEQNARLVRSAEQYYRTMFRGRNESWNLRDRHMADTLGELLRFLDQSGSPSRVIVWAHNSHLGDARATEMGERGELNVGQLVRERFGSGAVSIGFTTYSGTVTAASDWDEPSERKTVRPGLPGSYERLFHDTGIPRFLLPLRDDPDLSRALATPRLERAIGVIYRPDTERGSHYFHARLPRQFDFVLHFDRTTALEPLERTAGWEAGEPAETYPSGL
jgi:erythromycin esterase-like protein/adenine/guanine phosphoribosyltransferase-like PRPP-binding protein